MFPFIDSPTPSLSFTINFLKEIQNDLIYSNGSSQIFISSPLLSTKRLCLHLPNEHLILITHKFLKLKISKTKLSFFFPTCPFF